MGRPKKIQASADQKKTSSKRTRRELEIAIHELRIDIADYEASIACTRADIERLSLEYQIAEYAARGL